MTKGKETRGISYGRGQMKEDTNDSSREILHIEFSERIGNPTFKCLHGNGIAGRRIYNWVESIEVDGVT